LETLGRGHLARVCVIGAECTGKTTLAQRLAEHFGTVWVPEFAREYALDVARPLTFDDVDKIARGQIAGEDQLTLDASSILILDTDLVSTTVYSHYYYKAVPQWIAVEAKRRLADLYLMLDTDVPFIADPARDAEEHRADHAMAFRRVLEELGAKTIVINGDWEERFRRAVEAITPLCSPRNPSPGE